MTKLGTDVALHLPTELGTDVTGPSGPPPPTGPVLYGLQSFTTADYYQSVNNPGGIEGNATGFWVAALFRIDTQAVASATRALFARYSSAPLAGWGFLTTGTNAVFSFYNIDGVVSARPVNYGIAASNVGKIMLGVGVREPGQIRLYVNKVQSGAPFALTGFTPAVDRTYVGRRTSGNPASSATFFGGCGGIGIPTLAEIEAQADAVKVAGDIVEIPGKTDSLWSPKQDQAGSAPALLEDKIGAEDMQRVGAPVLVQVTNPVFGW